METRNIQGRYNAYTGKIQEKYPELSHEELHATEGWYERMAKLLQEKYGMTHEEAMEQVKEFAEDVDYDENEVDDNKIRSFHLDTNSDNTGEMTAVL